MAKKTSTKKADARGAPEGSKGNKPHERDEEAAKMIAALVGYGMTQEEIAHCLNESKGGGFSVSTLQKHYRQELDGGLAVQKSRLLAIAHDIAMDRDRNEGVSADVAFKQKTDLTKWLLGAVHKVRDGMEHDLSAGTINVTISKDDEAL